MRSTSPLGHYIDLSARDGATVRTFVVEPSQAPRAVLVVLQHMDLRRPGSAHADRSPAGSGPGLSGVNPHARHMCEAFAREGYLALAPSTFGRGVWGTDHGFRVEPKYWSSRLRLPLEGLPSAPVLLDVEAAIAHAARIAPNLRVGVAGFCWGGLLAWRAASQFKSLRASVCHYPGGIDGEADRQLQPLCPVLVQFAGEGRQMPRSHVDRFIQTHDREKPPGVRCEVHAAKYGFMQRQHRAYDEAAFAAAWHQTLGFLADHLSIPG